MARKKIKLRSASLTKRAAKRQKLTFAKHLCGILVIIVSCSTVATLVLYEDAGIWLLRHRWILFLFLAGNIVVWLVLVVWPKLSGILPFSRMCAISRSFCAANLSEGYSPVYVLNALLTTSAVISILATFAAFAPYDVTRCGRSFGFILIGFLIINAVGILMPYRPMMWIIASAGIIVFALMLVLDLQLLVGNNWNYSIADSAIAALGVYIDIMAMFQTILAFCGLIED